MGLSEANGANMSQELSDTDKKIGACHDCRTNNVLTVDRIVDGYGNKFTLCKICWAIRNSTYSRFPDPKLGAVANQIIKAIKEMLGK